MHSRLNGVFSYREEIAQPVQDVLTDGAVVSIGERVGQVPQAA